MLKTVWLKEQKNIEEGTALLLGGFDGLHEGHRLLLKKAQESHFPVGVMTIIGGKEGKGIFTPDERRQIFQNADVDFVFELSFAEIQPLSAEEFLRFLIKNYNPQCMICGDDFRFGMGAAGTPQSLKQATHVRVEILPLLERNGKKISSRSIKELLTEGKIETANAMLGEPYFLTGEVVHGRKIGSSMEFPTANIPFPQEKHALKKGVYETRVEIDEKEYKGITNYGNRPTFENNEVLTETYIDGFNGDLYGKKLTVKFIRFLRDIQKFASVEQLKNQLQEDVRRIRNHD